MEGQTLRLCECEQGGKGRQPSQARIVDVRIRGKLVTKIQSGRIRIRGGDRSTISRSRKGGSNRWELELKNKKKRMAQL